MEVTLYYSPFFTGETYRIPDGKPRFEKIVGDAGLLEFLELRLGLSGQESGAIDRLLAYRKALGDVMDEAFYKEAYGNDPLATAKEILRWRDLLVMEGFDPQVACKSPRLQKLAEVETLFHEPGTPERWKAVRDRAKGALPGVKIVVRYDLALLPRLVRETLERLGVQEGLSVSGRAFHSEGKSIVIRSFGTVAEAFLWAVDNHRDETVVCPDPFRLNAVLRNRGKAVLASSAGGDSSILQFFRLGLSLLERPVDVRNLLEYLRNGFSPIPDKQRYALAGALKRDGGRGENWTKALQDCEDASSVETFLESLLDTLVDEEGRVPKSVVTDWCEAVSKGVIDKKMVDEGNKSYVAELIALCDGMRRIVEKEPSDRVSVDFVQKAVKTLYTLSPVRADEAMARSWEAVDSHRSIVDTPEKLWWIPCNGGLGTPYPYSFLLKEEMDELHIRSTTDFVRYDFARMADVLDGAKEIVLFTCDFDGTDPLAEHPAVTLCKQAAELVPPSGQENSTTGVFKPLRTMETGVDLYPEAVQLSATSIETLIGHPFDFTMARKLRFRDLDSLQLSDLTPTQGTVAHLVFQRMLEDTERHTPGSIPDMRSMLEETAFKERVRQAAEEKGELLLLPENRTLFAHFTETIRKSIGVLLDILQTSGLHPRKSEEELKETLSGYDITGSVDFYASVSDEEIVVIDFKYSRGRSYIAKLEENKSIQLEIYAEGLEKKTGKKVVARAYYFFPINQLHTDDASGIFRGHGVIPHKAKAATPLSKRIWDSVAEREAELKKGTLEVDERIPVEEIAYHVLAGQNDLLDIPKQKVDGREVKSCSPFSRPTKYPILKNVIK